MPEVKDVIALQQKLMESTVFQARAARESTRKQRIPGYTETRWYSLFDMFKGLKQLKDVVLSYYIEEGLGSVNDEIWQTVDRLLPLLDIVEKVVKALEGETYGTICFVLMGVCEVRNAIHSLSTYEKYREVVRDWSVYYEDTVNETRKTWSPLLEVGCFLNPGLEHSRYLTLADGQKVISFLQQPPEWSNFTLASAVTQVVDSNSQPRESGHVRYRAHVQTNGVMIELADHDSSRPVRRSPLTALLEVASSDSESRLPASNSLLDELNAYSALIKPGLDLEDFWEKNRRQLPRLATAAQRSMT